MATMTMAAMMRMTATRLTLLPLVLALAGCGSDPA
jgi:hypothetical protein